MSLSQPSRTIVVEPVRVAAAPVPAEPAPDNPPQLAAPAAAVAKS